MADILLLVGSLVFSGCGAALLVLVPPGWMMDREKEYTSMHPFRSQVLGEDRTGMYGGCMSSIPASLDSLVSSLRDKSWVPLLILGLGLALTDLKELGQPVWFETDDDSFIWLQAINNFRFWLAIAAAVVGAVLGGVYKERKG